MDILSIQKIWEDEHVVELSIAAMNRNIKSRINVYVDTAAIRDLIESLLNFVNNEVEFEWTVSDKASNTSNYFYLRAFYANKSKHVAFEIEMLDKSDGLEGFRASCFIKTEIHYIDELIRALKTMIRK